MKFAAAWIAVTALAGGHALAQDASPGAPPVQDPPAPESQGSEVVRPGDTRLSCEALISEINTLNQAVADNQSSLNGRAMAASREMTRGAPGGSTASTALTLGAGVAAALIPGAGLATGLVQGVTDRAAEAAAAAHQAKQERQMDELMTEMAAGADAMIPAESRIEHLTNILFQKGC